MSFIFETFLLLLVRLVQSRNLLDVEIVLLPLWNTEESVEVPLRFKAFDQTVELKLHRNDRIMAPQFRVWKHDHEDSVEELPELSKSISCHYLHRNDYGSAAVSLCGEDGVHGLIFLDNVTLEITPLQNQEFSVFNNHFVRQRSELLGEPHIVKRANIPLTFFEDQLKYHTRSDDELMEENSTNESFTHLFKNPPNEPLTLELALFFDEPGYHLFSPFFDGNDEKIRDMLLAYVNGVQAIYHHPSLGIRIDISLVRLDIMQKQPRDLPHYNGDRGKLLDSFCKYASKVNPSDESHPNHWDMGLYVSGLDFYVMEAGQQKNSGTMGLAIVGGLCIEEYSCVIVELGATNQFGKPFPSAGFTSVYIAAHEIGHNLGMHHDSTGNSCPKDGYIMSPSRGTYGETVWSECSHDVAIKLAYTKPCLSDRQSSPRDDQLDHARYFNLPGRQWTAKKQCEIFLRDKNATVVTFYKACESLQCQTPGKSGHYFAGPALDGTYCAPGKECQGGECKNALQIYPATDKPMDQSGWTEWKTGPCKSGCLVKSTGVQTKQRFCNKSGPKDVANVCQGLYHDVVLCRDDNLCKKKRRSIVEYATLRCNEFSEKLEELDRKGGGLQAPHEFERPWMACAIFCRRKDIASYYTPRVELNDLGLDPYFPDGTWCHAEEGQNYFCRQHHCLPESFRFEKTSFDSQLNDDLKFLTVRGFRLDDRMKYLGSRSDVQSLLTSLPGDIGFPLEDDEWIDKDYIDFKPWHDNMMYEL